MLSAVAPSLAQRRGAQRVVAKPYTLWKVLEQQSKPCRFLELPAKLQDRITSLTLADRSQNIGAHQPGITRVNRQIRRETLPVYYDSAVFHIHPRKIDKCLYGNHKALGGASELMVTQWIERSVSDNAKFLRHVVLYLDYDFRAKKPNASRSSTTTTVVPKKVQFLFSEASGLKIAADGSCNTKLKIQNYQIIIERQRKMLKLMGDSIMLALLSNIELWNNGGLGWKN